MDIFERLLFSGAREWACSRIEGDVLEVVIGTGRNMPLYPKHARVTGVELSSEMLALARRRAAELGVDVELRSGDAQKLDFADGSFDTVLITFAFCTIPDQRVGARGDQQGHPRSSSWSTRRIALPATRRSRSACMASSS